MASNPHYDYGLLRRALGISLLLHALLLLQPGVSAGPSQTHVGHSLIALLRPNSVAARNVPLSASAAPVSHAAPRMPAIQHPIQSATTTVDAPSLIEATRTIPHLSETENVQANAANAGAQQVDAGAISRGSPDASGTLDFAEEKKLYLFAIAAEARRVRKYPPRAAAAGWSGTVEIRVAVAADGIPLAPLLQKSSGYSDLDSAALSLVGMALKRTPVPVALRGRGFEFPLPIVFDINND